MGHPIDEYVEAVDAAKTDRARAAERLARALGGDHATPPILSSIERILDRDTLLHRVVLDTVVAEAKRRERRGGDEV